MAALWEVKQHSVVHLAAHINDSTVCVCDTLSDYVAYHWAFLPVFHIAMLISVCQ